MEPNAAEPVFHAAVPEPSEPAEPHLELLPGLEPVETPEPEAAEAEAEADDEDEADEPAALPIGGRYLLQLEDGAYEGRHVLEVTATDSLGTKTVTTRAFFVDSSEELAEVAGLRTGAKGRDVVQLHQVLAVKLEDRGRADLPLRPWWNA